MERGTVTQGTVTGASGMSVQPRCIPVFRLLGWLCGVAAALLAVVAATALGDAGFAPQRIARAYGFVVLAASFLLGFAAAMLFGFAANLEILHDIRSRLDRSGGSAQGDD